MLVLGQQKDLQRITLREAVPATAAVRAGRKIVTPASDGEPEAFVLMAPITSPMRRRAARATRRLLGDSSDFSDLDVDQLIDASEAGARELVRLGIVEWGGIGDADGVPLPVTPDRDTRFTTANQADRQTGTVDLLLADEDLFEHIADAYVKPDAVRRAEKNGLSASPTGTGGAATPGKTTAASVANRKVRRTAAKNARTSSMRSRAKPAKQPGKR